MRSPLSTFWPVNVFIVRGFSGYEKLLQSFLHGKGSGNTDLAIHSFKFRKLPLFNISTLTDKVRLTLSKIVC